MAGSAWPPILIRSVAYKEQTTMSEQQNVVLVQTALAAFGRGDVDGV